jgi:hypothetical protein
MPEKVRVALIALLADMARGCLPSVAIPQS